LRGRHRVPQKGWGELRGAPTVESRGRLASWAGCAVVLVAWLIPAIPAGALDLRVQGRSQLTVDVRTAGTQLLVSGSLRDDLGQSLPHRKVRVELERSSRERVEEASTAETNRDGEYRVRLEVPPGEYTVRATFEPTPHLRGARAEGSVRAEREPVDLEVRGASFVRSGVRSVPLRMRATVEGNGVRVPLEVRAPGGSLELQTDDRGRAQIDVARLLGEGSNRVRVVAPEGRYRDSASVSHRVRVAETVAVDASLEAVFDRLQRGAAVTGIVRSGGAPVPDAGVEVELYRERAEGARGEGESTAEPLQQSGRTGDDGSFRLFFSRNELPDGEWSGRVRVRPDTGDAWVRDLGVLRIDRTLSRMVVDGAAGLALLAVLFVLGREGWRLLSEKLAERRRERDRIERRRRAFQEEERLEPVSVPDLHDEAADEQVLDRVRGQVWDGWRSASVEGARVDVRGPGEELEESTRTDDRGRFAFDDLGSGAWELVIEADYYVRGRFEFELPHDGSLDSCRFELVPVPLKIRRLYQSLVEAAAGDDLWGELSPREIQKTIRGVLGEVSTESEGPDEAFSERLRAISEGRDGDLNSGREYLETLTDLVEETYFGPRRYGEATWRVAREVAVELQETIDDRVE